jgi:hypothetical protein
MNNLTLILPVVAAAALLLVIIVIVVRRRRPRTLNMDKFTERWRDLQKNCADKKTWPIAIVEADDLLADALKLRRFKGKNTGERLVAAQHSLTNNESVWFGHKLRNQIVNEDLKKLRKQDVLEALSGFRQALRDLGALK